MGSSKEVPVVFLERFDFAAAEPVFGDALHGGARGGGGGQVGDLVFYGGLADVGVVPLAGLAGGGVNDEMDGAALDLVLDIGTLHFVDFGAQFGCDSPGLEELECALGGLQPEPELRELPGGFYDRFFVAVGHADEDDPGLRQRRLGGFFGFEVGQAESSRQSEHLTGGPHFRAEERIDFGKHVEGEGNLLDPDVREFAALELEVAQGCPKH